VVFLARSAEAVFLSVSGGLAGIVTGIAISAVASLLLGFFLVPSSALPRDAVPLRPSTSAKAGCFARRHIGDGAIATTLPQL